MEFFSSLYSIRFAIIHIQITWWLILKTYFLKPICVLAHKFLCFTLETFCSPSFIHANNGFLIRAIANGKITIPLPIRWLLALHFAKSVLWGNLIQYWTQFHLLVICLQSLAAHRTNAIWALSAVWSISEDFKCSNQVSTSPKTTLICCYGNHENHEILILPFFLFSLIQMRPLNWLISSLLLLQHNIEWSFLIKILWLCYLI